jgi:hypothetical protein
MMQRVARFGFVLMIGLMCLSPRGAEAAPGPSEEQGGTIPLADHGSTDNE